MEQVPPEIERFFRVLESFAESFDRIANIMDADLKLKLSHLEKHKEAADEAEKAKEKPQRVWTNNAYTALRRMARLFDDELTSVKKAMEDGEVAINGQAVNLAGEIPCMYSELIYKGEKYTLDLTGYVPSGSTWTAEVQE